ncbi:hypothetical protein, partial [Candidatus Methanoperedens nitratireducens]|uniref:hypothetical protein n=1 Tax=Candidatus Methanoperedens nitratireducens TaxID=1392998 RepID=UPI001C5479C3
MGSIEVVGSIIVAIVMLGVIYRFGSGATYIGRYEVGILTRRIGKTMPSGQVIARNGEVGIQADTMMPGIYWLNPLIWKIEKEQITTIGETEIGTIESIDGEPIPTGRLLGDAIECNQFQDAKMFLDGGGKKGPQTAILRPGAYRINTKVFKVTKHPVTKIEEEHIGIVVAVDGQPLPSGYIIAPKPENDEHKYYQDGQLFIANGGYRGPQLDTLQPGEYYINPLLFKVKQYEVAEVPPGYVAVLRSKHSHISNVV